jgi:hypothetical protein
MRIRQDQPNPADIGNGDPVVALKLETGREVGAVAVMGDLPFESRQAGDQADSDYQTHGLICSRQGG